MISDCDMQSINEAGTFGNIPSNIDLAYWICLSSVFVSYQRQLNITMQIQTIKVSLGNKQHIKE